VANEVGRAKAIVELDFSKFERDIAKVRALLRSLKDEPTKIKIDADVENLTGEIQKIKRTVNNGVGDVKVGVDFDKAAAQSLSLEIDRLKKRIREFGKVRAEETRLVSGERAELLRQLALDQQLLLNDLTVKVDLDEGDLVKAEATLAALVARKREILIDVDTGANVANVAATRAVEQARLKDDLDRLKRQIRQFNEFRSEKTRLAQGGEKERLRQLAFDSKLLLNDLSVKVDLDENDIAQAELALAALVDRKREILIGVEANIADLAVVRAAAQVQLAEFKKALTAEKLEIGESIRLANTAEAKNELRLLATEARRILNDIPLNVDLDGVAAAEKRLAALTRERTVIVDIDSIAAAGAALAALEQQEINVPINVDLDGAAKIKADLARLKKSLDSEKLELSESIRLANSADAKNELRLLAAEAKRILNDIPLDVDLDGIAAAEARLDALARRRKAVVDVDVDKGALSELGGLLRIQQGLGPLALSGSLGGIGSSLGSAAGPIAAIVVPLAAATAALAGIAVAFGTVGSAAASAGVEITKFAIDSAAQLEVPLKSLARITGDQFEEIGAQVIDFARTTPFTVESAVKATQLTIAGIGIKPEESVDFVQTIADAVAVGGGTTANFEAVALALTKSAGRGKLQQRAINQLIVNTKGLFKQEDLFANISEDLGITQGEAFDRLAEGTLTTAETLEAVKRTLKEIPGAAGAAARATDNLAGAITNLEDNLQTASLGGFRGFLESAKDALAGDPDNGIGGISDALANQFSIIGPAVERAFAGIGPRIAPAINAIGPLIANTIDAIGPSVAALVSAIQEISAGFAIGFGQGEFGTVTKAIEGVGRAIALIGVVGRPAFNIIIEGFKQIGNVAQQALGLITLPFTALVKVISEAGSLSISVLADIVGAAKIALPVFADELGTAEKFLNNASAKINKIGDQSLQFSTNSIRSGAEGLIGNGKEINRQIQLVKTNFDQFKDLVASNGRTPVFDTEAIKASLSDFAVTEEAGSLAGQSYLNAFSNAVATGADEVTGEQLGAAFDEAVTAIVEATSVVKPALADLGAAFGQVGKDGEEGFATIEEAIDSYQAEVLLAAKQQQLVNLLQQAGYDQIAQGVAKGPAENINEFIDQLADLGPAWLDAKEKSLDALNAGTAAIDEQGRGIAELQALAAAGVVLNTTAPTLPELEARLAALTRDQTTLLRVGANTDEVKGKIDRVVAEINARKAILNIGVKVQSGTLGAIIPGLANFQAFGRRHGGPLDPGQLSWVGEGGRELIYTGTTAASVINNQTSERIAGMLGLDTPRTFNAAAIGGTVSTSPQVTQASLGITNQQARIIGSTFAQTVGGVTAVIAPPYSDPEAIASKIRYNSKASQRP
jgi:tape measure domain-containing protein